MNGHCWFSIYLNSLLGYWVLAVYMNKNSRRHAVLKLSENRVNIVRNKEQTLNFMFVNT